MKRFIRNSWAYFVGVLLIFLGWEIASIIYQNDLVFPGVFDIWKSFIEIITNKQSYAIFCATFLRILIAVFCSVLIALILAFLSRKSKIFKKIITPLLTLLKSTPVASIILILLLIFGHENSSIIIALMIMMPILYEGFYNATNEVTSGIKDEIKMISNYNLLVIKEIYIPLMLPSIITSILQSFSLGIKSLIMAEVLTQPKYSIGKELGICKNNLEMGKIISWTIILVIITIVFEIIMNRIKTINEKEK